MSDKTFSVKFPRDRSIFQVAQTENREPDGVGRQHRECEAFRRAKVFPHDEKNPRSSNVTAIIGISKVIPRPSRNSHPGITTPLFD